MTSAAPIVFVVDDDASVRDGLRRLMSSVGLEVEVFAIAQACLQDLEVPLLVEAFCGIAVPPCRPPALSDRDGEAPPDGQGPTMGEFSPISVGALFGAR